MQLGLQVRFPNLVCKKKPSLMIPYLYLLSLFSFSNLSYSFTPYSFSLLSAFCLHVLTLAHLSTFWNADYEFFGYNNPVHPCCHCDLCCDRSGKNSPLQRRVNFLFNIHVVRNDNFIQYRKERKR